MTHTCAPHATMGDTYSIWFAKWIKNNGRWFIRKVCRKCVSNPDYYPVIVISIDDSTGPCGCVRHVLYHMYGDSPLGPIRNRYLSIETGLVSANDWEVISISDIDDEETTQISRIVQAVVG